MANLLNPLTPSGYYMSGVAATLLAHHWFDSYNWSINLITLISYIEHSKTDH